jgi:hypothetical protein
MRALIPCYGTAPGVVVTDDDEVVGDGRVIHHYADGSRVQVRPDGSLGKTAASGEYGAYETAAVSYFNGSLDSTRNYCPDPNSGKVYPFRVGDPGTVPNV